MKLYMLVFYVPKNFCDEVKNAVFEAGGGRLGNYEACCWQVKGEGQFRPLSGSHPFMGETGKVEYVPEYKVELVCASEVLDAVLTALKSAHPYETPAYVYWEVQAGNG